MPLLGPADLLWSIPDHGSSQHQDSIRVLQILAESGTCKGLVQPIILLWSIQIRRVLAMAELNSCFDS
jgi:hypothetical protein